MNDFEIVEYPEVTALTRRATCTHTDLGPTIMRLFGEIIESNRDTSLVEPPCIYYIEWRPDDCEIEAAAPVEVGTVPGPGTSITNYPSHQAIRATYTGPYEGLPQAWTELWSYVQQNNINAAGTPWDRYVTDPGQEADATKWITEIYIPVSIPKV